MKIKKDNKEKFFNLLAIEYGVRDTNIVKNFYYALVKVIIRQLFIEGGVYGLPDLGTFKIKVHKQHLVRVASTGNLMTVPPLKIISFRPDKKLRDYVRNHD